LLTVLHQTRNGSRILSLDVRAEGPTQILEISNYSEDTSLYKRRPRAASVSEPLSRQNTISSQAETFEAVTEEIKPSLSINLDLEGLGLSLINKRLVEVLYFTLSKLKLEYTDSEVAQTVNLALGWIQIDNQLHEAMYPIVLQPMVIQKEGAGIDVLPAIQASAIVLKDSGERVPI
jgi:vacuolar protein sorting-associated protein 13A/C